MSEERKQGQQRAPGQIPIKMSDDMLGGVYANLLLVSHTREEFVLDFVSLFPGGGRLNARVITSPGHLKRILKAVEDNLNKYEATFGKVVESEEPPKAVVIGEGGGKPN
ncbi:MAG: DUF3467 domain-containing protein [Acidobacteriota bacterium]